MNIFTYATIFYRLTTQTFTIIGSLMISATAVFRTIMCSITFIDIY